MLQSGHRPNPKRRRRKGRSALQGKTPHQQAERRRKPRPLPPSLRKSARHPASRLQPRKERYDSGVHQIVGHSPDVQEASRNFSLGVQTAAARSSEKRKLRPPIDDAYRRPSDGEKNARQSSPRASRVEVAAAPLGHPSGLEKGKRWGLAQHRQQTAGHASFHPKKARHFPLAV